MTYQEKYSDCLSYINSYWDKIIHKPTTKKINHHVVTIPYVYITPNEKKFSYIYYWDSFFMFRGLINTKREWIIKQMVNNFSYLFNKYHIIPNSNQPGFLGRSQPPFFSSMILDAYNCSSFNKGILKSMLNSVAMLMREPIITKKWFQTMIDYAKQEYEQVWIDEYNFYNHHVAGHILGRYGDRDIGYAHSSELESGWDMTCRFYNRCDEFLPIDLNVYLYKYERDFTNAAIILDQPIEHDYWEEKAERRRNEILRLMWNDKKGFFFDYEYKKERQSEFLSLAGFIPMWMGIPDFKQAEKMLEMLKVFETDYGLVVTAKQSLLPLIDLSGVAQNYRPALETVLKSKQWDYPHIWAPIEYLVVIGLLRYGFQKDATRIMEKSVRANAAYFRKNNTFLEKLDATTGGAAGDFHYPNQTGFGWTNAIFYRYVMILDDLQAGKQIYKTKPSKPPYAFDIPH